jgi:succinate dehydrogenase / fumarate reductase cytochrome b subunit
MNSSSSSISAAAEPEIRFFTSSPGKKIVMAATGLLLLGFVIVHMLGNLQIYLGPEKLDAYSAMLHQAPLLLWGARVVLLASVLLHIAAAAQLARLNRKARPVRYYRKLNLGSTYASRTMVWSGPILFAFVIYHLLHFTTGSAHPEFRAGAVYRNIVLGFQQTPVSIAYIAAMVMLGMHLYHGAWSMFQTAGVSHPRYSAYLRKLAALLSTAIVVGNVSIPISVMAGWVK